MNNRHRIAHLMIAIGLVISLAACSSTPATPAVEDPAPATQVPVVEVQPTEPPAPETPAEFTFTGWAINEGASKEVVTGFMKEYSEANNAVVKEQAFPYGEMLNQLVLQANGGSADGAAQLDIAWLATMAATGKLMDLSAYTEGRDYTEAALLSGQVNGVQYGLPWTTGSIGLAANKQILDEAGVTEMPKTIAEFEAALVKIKEYNPEIIPYAGMTAAAQLKDIVPWIWTFGGTVIDESGEVTLGDAGSVAALEWYKSLLDRGLMAPEMDRFTARQLFSQGKVAFYDDAIVLKGIVTKDSPIPNLGDLIVPLSRPVLKEGDTPQALLWGHVVVVFEGENSQAAAQWTQFLTSDQATATTYFEKMALPPTTETALNSDAVKSDAFTSTWSQSITATANPNPFAVYAESARMESILTEQVNAYLVGSVASAQEALDKAAVEISALMK
ncbi:MAG TPA: extracellular solute-binding protein [Anaerolineales bacterium]|nr:extracellular solute-binding protein [Anaerolineales bacterium]